MWRWNTEYQLLTNATANSTSTKTVFTQDFRHIWLTVSSSNTAFTGTIRVKGSRVKDWDDVAFATASSQTNKWSYLQITKNDTWANLDWATWLALTASSDEVYDFAVNVDWFNWMAVELSSYSWSWNVTVDIVTYNNQ